MLPAALLAAFRETLVTGGYNLLLGAGVALDSRNSRAEFLRSGEQLRKDLCTLTGAKESTSLPRVYALLTPLQRQTELVARFAGCKPGPSVKDLTRFLWRRMFTFNIDDVFENLYLHTPDKKQTLVPLNFDAPFEPTPERNELHAVHLHGSVQQPDSGFVFSPAEYVRVMTTLNPWMHLLSEILATEAFIIAGASLNEIDLEYYLSHRNKATPRRGRGPSLLIEPYPDVATRSDCERYGLTLVTATFGEFMDWLRNEVPAPPSVADLLVPDTMTLFSKGPTALQMLRFFSDFELVAASEQPLSSTPSAFLYGRAPDWSDLHQHVDIERADNSLLQSVAQDALSRTDRDPRLVLVLDDAGTGKTTTIRRVAHSLARQGKAVLGVRTLSRLDAINAINCLKFAAAPLLLVVDGFADHAEQIVDILNAARAGECTNALTVLAAERGYRRGFLDVVLPHEGRIDRSLVALTVNECQQLVERYRQFGLAATDRAISTPQEFAKGLHGEVVSIAVCRILNDFRPLDTIIESLWEAAGSEHRLPYLSVAVAQHCYGAGLRYSLLQSILGPTRPVGPLLENTAPLRLVTHVVDEEFLVAINSVVAERVLQRAVRSDVALLREAFIGIATALAPHVNRKAIMRRSPEARLAGRLFDADKIVKPLLGSGAAEFYVDVQEGWAWNSRYWEQRALLTAETDLETGLQYARHAVAIERHPFPLTTLGKLLLRRMELGNAPAEAFGEAFTLLSSAIETEAERSRISVHPYVTLLGGGALFLELGGALTTEQRDALSGYSTEARYRFAADPLVDGCVRRLDKAMH